MIKDFEIKCGNRQKLMTAKDFWRLLTKMQLWYAADTAVRVSNMPIL